MADKKPIKMQLPTKKAKSIITTSKGHTVVGDGLPNISGYGKGDTVSVPLTRAAQAIGGGASVTMTQPMFFSPLHTPQNWQIASKRREVYQWCLVPKTDILMHDGRHKNIEDVKIGDYVITHTGEAKKVLKKGCRYVNEDIQDIKVSGLQKTLSITGNHKIYSFSNKSVLSASKNLSEKINSRFSSTIISEFQDDDFPDPDWIESEQLEKGDFLFSPKIVVEKETMSYNGYCIDEDMAFLIGLYAAEGCMAWYKYKDTKRPKGIRFCLSFDEHEAIERLRSIVEDKLGLTLNIYKNSKVNGRINRSYSLHVYNRKLADLMNDLIGTPSTSKSIDNRILKLPDNILCSFLTGLFTGDGSINKNTQHLELSTSSYDMCSQVAFMAMRLNIPYKIYYAEKHHRYENAKTQYHLLLDPIKCQELNIFKIKDNIRRDTSFTIFKGVRETPYGFARRIIHNNKKPYSGLVYTLEVEDNHSYVANGLIVKNCRFYYENEPKVAAGIDFYSQFPVNGFKLECKKKKIAAFYERLCDRLELLKWLRLISHERFLLGDVFVFLEIDSPDTRGETDLQPGEAPTHADGIFKRIMVLNPDWIEVYNTPLAGEPEIVMLPDEELKKIVMTRQPESIYKRLPENIKQLIASGRPIRLSNTVTSHIKHGGSPYGTYGDSLLRRLFTILAYKTKLMTANWIVAERLILPVRVVKVGEKDRPAGEDDIADVVQQLSAVANDPNLTIVTHHAFEYEWFGACYDDETLFLTDKYGWMSRSQYKNIIHEEDDPVRIMVFDPNTGQSFYEIPSDFYEYDYDGFMVRAKGSKIDFMVTPNHKMLGYKRDKKTSYSMEARDFVKIGESDRYVRSVADYISEEFKETVNIDGNEVFIDDFLKFAGYYLAEGYTQFDEDKRQYNVSISKSPYINKSYCDDIDSFASNINNNVEIYAYDQKVTTWNYLNKNIAKYVKDQFGENSHTKKIPQWVKNLPPEKLSILIEAYINGDGARQSYATGEYVQMGTVSSQLASDLSEILFKSGFAPVISDYKKDGKQFIINCSMSSCSKGRFSRIRDDQFSAERYQGKVWCFSTSTGFFVTQRNGRISIQGNTGKIHNITNELEQIGKEMLDGMMLNQALLNGEASGYSSAQVGVEMLIRRLESWRKELAQWVEKNIFLPVAKMQGFIDEEESEAIGETVYLYPHLKWDDLKLRDPTNRMQMAMNLHQNGTISTQTLLEMFELDYDQEIERIREEQVQVMGNGQVVPGGGMPGGGMPGGGIPMGGDPLGGMGGPPMGGPPMGGIPMGGDPMGGMGGPAVGGPSGAMPASAQSAQKVMKKGKGRDKKEDLPPAPAVQNIQLTKPEAKVYRILSGMKLPFQIYAQYKYQVPGEQQPYLLDFALPDLGINIEADGEKWHSTPEDKGSDQKRDYKLAEMGWTVIRVSETALNENVDGVERLLADNIRASVEERRKMNSKSANSTLTGYKYADSQTGLPKCYLVKSIPQHESE